MSTVHHKSTRHDFLNVVTLGELNAHSNPMAEIATVKIGITIAGLRAFSTLIQWVMGAIAKALDKAERTLLQRLSKQISENALEVARLSNFGIAYFCSIDNWNTSLDTPNVQFDN